jgi:hypothetical protein
VGSYATTGLENRQRGKKNNSDRAMDLYVWHGAESNLFILTGARLTASMRILNA